MHVDIQTNSDYTREHNNQQQLIPIIFVRYQKTILIPDFNICALLKMINPNIDIHTVAHYVRIFSFNLLA